MMRLAAWLVGHHERKSHYPQDEADKWKGRQGDSKYETVVRPVDRSGIVSLDDLRAVRPEITVNDRVYARRHEFLHLL